MADKDPAPTPDQVEAAAKAIHDHWQNGNKTWAETLEKMPGAAADFRIKALLGLEAARLAGFRVHGNAN